DHARAPCAPPAARRVVIGVAVPDRVETDLAAGAIACPGCGGALRPWGHARARRVRDLITTVALRPRRARCSACRATHVLLPGTVLPRPRRYDRGDRHRAAGQ